MVKEKKRKYGIKRLSKEENMRMTKRREERLEIAKAKKTCGDSTEDRER